MLNFLTLFLYFSDLALSIDRLVLSSEEQSKVCLFLQKGDGVTVHFEQAESSFYVTLLGPDDRILEKRASVSHSDRAIMFEWTADADGDYSFLIEPVRRDGAFAMSLVFLGDHQQRIKTLKEDPRYLSVKKNLKPVRSINPNDTDFSDLQPLKAAIGDKPYVFLGEQNHAEAESMSAKIRLVKFLHQEMGFEVLAWESDLYSTGKLNDGILNQDVSDDLWLSSLSYFWAPLTEMVPLREYLMAQAQSERPLQLWGVDGQHRYHVTARHFVDDFKAVLLQHNLELPEELFFELIQNTIYGKYVTKKLPTPSQASIAMVKNNTKRLRDQLLERAETDLNASLWVQLLENLSLFWEAAFQPGYFQHRDQVMADNFYWLAKKRFPGKKIIFWAASSHLAKNRTLVKHGSKYLSYDFISAGTRIDQALPGQVYSILCTALSGEFARGYIKRDRESDAWLARTIHPNQHLDFELEEMMGLTGVAYGFLDIKAADLAWLNEPAIARPFGNLTASAPWSEVTDSFFFIRKVSPVTYTDWAVKWREEKK